MLHGCSDVPPGGFILYGVVMATRYSGKLRISAVLDDRTGNYRVGVTDGKHRWRGSVGAPASGFGAGVAYDSPRAFDQVASAALSFASDEADWVAEQAYMTDSGWHVGRSENEKWMPAKRRSSRDPASREKSRGRPSRTARKPARAPRRRRDEEKSLAERFASLADYAVGVRDKLQQLGLTASEAKRAADEWWGLIQEGWETAKSTLSVARTILGFFRGEGRDRLSSQSRRSRRDRPAGQSRATGGTKKPPGRYIRMDATRHGWSAHLIDARGRVLNTINGDRSDSAATVWKAAKRHWPHATKIAPMSLKRMRP